MTSRNKSGLRVPDAAIEGVVIIKQLPGKKQKWTPDEDEVEDGDDGPRSTPCKMGRSKRKGSLHGPTLNDANLEQTSDKDFQQEQQGGVNQDVDMQDILRTENAADQAQPDSEPRLILDHPRSPG